MSDDKKNTDHPDENLFDDDDLDFEDFDDLDFEDDIPDAETSGGAGAAVPESAAASPDITEEAITESEPEAASEPAFDDDFEDISWDDFDEEAAAQSAETPEETEGQPAKAKAKKAAKPPKVKSGSLLQNKAVLGVILLAAFGGGGFLYLQMTGGLGTPQGGTAGTAQITDVQIPQDPMPLQEPAPAPPEIAAGQPELTKDQMRSIEEDMAASIEEAPPMPAPISDPEEGVSAPKSAPPEVLTPMPELEDLDEQPKLASLNEPLEDSPTATQREAVPAPMVEEPAALAPPPVTPVIESKAENLTVESSASDENIAALSERVAGIEKRIEDFNQALNDKIEETSKKLNDLSNTLSQLEKKISSLSEQQSAGGAAPQQQPAAASVPVPAKKAPAPPKEEAAKPETAKAAPATEQPAPPPAKPATAPSRTSSTVEIRPEAAPQWELRAAQPGKAMVANKANGDVLSVSVGDSLRGIGKITAIEQQNGKWVVQGAMGSISQ